jgi:aspartyl-tRNA synthetase
MSELNDQVAVDQGVGVSNGQGVEPSTELEAWERPGKVMCGWVDSVDAAAQTFVLRSSGGVSEILCDRPQLNETYRSLKSEYVVAATVEDSGHGAGLEPSAVLRCTNLEVLNGCDNPPFTPRNRSEVSANLRSRYRYLEFRAPDVRKIFWTRHKLMHHISTYLDRAGCISVETPVLSTPSATGAKEFCVASSRTSEVSYALPQSSQAYGQLLVIGGVEAYYQWARCFRDEDLRANRQPEFTQLHLEMAFVDQCGLMTVIEGALAHACEAVGMPIETPMPRLSYEDALRWYGTDKPDLRFDVVPELLPYMVTESPFGQGLNLLLTQLPEEIELTAEDAKGLQEVARQWKFTLLGFHPRSDSGKFIKPHLTYEEVFSELSLETEFTPGSVPVWLGRWKFVDNLRRTVYHYLIQHKELNSRTLKFLWVVDFPLFAVDPEDSGKLLAQNHPFTAPVSVDQLLSCHKHKDLLKVKSQAFDLVINGEEVGSGSMLIHQLELQRHVLNLLGFSRKSVREHFGFILDALRFGAPPMGGFGLGFDRFVASVCGADKIRNVIAFPKTKQGYCPVTRAEG